LALTTYSAHSAPPGSLKRPPPAASTQNSGLRCFGFCSPRPPFNPPTRCRSPQHHSTTDARRPNWLETDILDARSTLFQRSSTISHPRSLDKTRSLRHGLPLSLLHRPLPPLCEVAVRCTSTEVASSAAVPQAGHTSNPPPVLPLQTPASISTNRRVSENFHPAYQAAKLNEGKNSILLWPWVSLTSLLQVVLAFPSIPSPSPSVVLAPLSPSPASPFTWPIIQSGPGLLYLDIISIGNPPACRIKISVTQSTRPSDQIRSVVSGGHWWTLKVSSRRRRYTQLASQSVNPTVVSIILLPR